MTELSPSSLALILAAGFASILYLLSLLGWSQLATVYAHDAEEGSDFSGSWIRFQSFGFRRGPGYNGAARFGAGERGLFLVVWPLVRIAHPPLFFPWEDLSAVRRKAWWVERVDISFAKVPRVEMRITVGLARKLAEVHPQAARIFQGALAQDSSPR